MSGDNGWWIILLACSFGCGNSGRTSSSAGPSSGGTGPASTAGSGGIPHGAGTAGMPSTAGMAGTSSVPEVDVAVSATYRWNECGRIEASARPSHAAYASDGSIVVLEETGRLRLFPEGSNYPTTLLSAGGEFTDGLFTISSDGKLLSVARGATREWYAAADGEPIGAGTSELAPIEPPEPVVPPDAVAESCAALARVTASGAVMTVGTESVCFWESLTGPLLGRAARPTVGNYLRHEEAFGDDGYYSLGSDQLVHVDLQGEVVSRVDLSGFVPADQRDPPVALVPETHALVLSLVSEEGEPRFIALDAHSGNVIWEFRWTLQDRFEYGSGGFRTSFVLDPDRSVMLVEEGPVLSLTDGTLVGRDVRALGPRVALTAGARRQLRLGEQVADWDAERQEVRQLYGSHTDRITDVDVSPDGRHFATHGYWAVTWQVDPDFSRSRPLFHGVTGDVSLYSAIDPSGSTMLVSGDNIAVATRKGSLRSPGPGAADCFWSAIWAFSPTGPWAAGSHYSNDVHVYDTRTFELAATLRASTCFDGVAFSPDGSKLVTGSLELFETVRWTRLWDVPPEAPTPYSESEGHSAVAFSPDGQEIALARFCDSFNGGCDVTRFRTIDGSVIADVPELDGGRARYSPEGHWLVSGGRLFHIPTGLTLMYADGIEVAAFTPEGDLIAGAREGWLARYCRSASASGP